MGRSRLWAELSYEDEHFLNAGGLLRTVEEVTQLDAGITLRLADLPGLRRVPTRLYVSFEGANLTEEARVDSLGLPLPDQALWYVRFRLAPR